MDIINTKDNLKFEFSNDVIDLGLKDGYNKVFNDVLFCRKDGKFNEHFTQTELKNLKVLLNSFLKNELLEDYVYGVGKVTTKSTTFKFKKEGDKKIKVNMFNKNYSFIKERCFYVVL